MPKKKITSKSSSQKPLFSSPIAHTLLAGFLFAIVFGVLFVVSKNFISQQAASAFTCANSISCISDLSGKYDSSAKEAEFNGEKVQVPQNLAENITPTSPVLGDSTTSNKHIYVDLTSQTLYAKEGDQTVFQFPISSGIFTMQNILNTKDMEFMARIGTITLAIR